MKYKNRYGDLFTFEENEQGNVQWSGNFKHYRAGYKDNPDEPTYIDPSGGPFISIGDSMDEFGLDGIVSGFVSNENGFEILIEKK
jgi:hypothetical protein